MQKTFTIAVCGCGDRGLDGYLPYLTAQPARFRVTAGADIRPERLAMLRERYGVPAEQCFASDDALLQRPRLADVMLIATQDRQHVPAALRALEKGYHVLLEKPISPSLAECRALQAKAKAVGRTVLVCHVLRYTAFYSTLERLLRAGTIGKVESIDAIEHVAYWHYAHSFVRGNWRRSDETSPMILAKSCHDMDILRWLAGEPCLRVQSFGALDHFTARNAPAGAAAYCLQAGACRENCPYDAEKIYITGQRCGVRRVGDAWPCNVVTAAPTEEKLRRALYDGPYGRCVYHCDNDVVDHQTVNLEFANNIHATFTMTAFTAECYRTVHVTGTHGEVEGDLRRRQLVVRRFGQPEQVIDLDDAGARAGHGGGDAGIAAHLYELLTGAADEARTGLDVSVESHAMALAAEASRLAGGRTIELADFTG